MPTHKPKLAKESVFLLPENIKKKISLASKK
jgi:hypothetical protein